VDVTESHYVSFLSPGFLTTAKAGCEPLYNGGSGGRGGNVQPKWSFNPRTNHCVPVMVRSGCPRSLNCFHTEADCNEDCGKCHLIYLNALYTLL
ncbi:secreted protein, putative, partial [Ixodes scapularis]